MNMLAARTAQASLAARIFESLVTAVGPDRASALLAEAIENDARCAGAAFARLAAQGASLTHFATVLERWREGGALTIEDVALSANTLSFAVTDCAYARAYADMGLDPGLGFILSCRRDEPFALGYSPRLSMERSRTIMQGSPACLFTFTWAG
ncbi:L-2-amino-thiazoline-4-carboxylic acid hydrolase [Desulfomicrobium salsuginis]